MSGTLVPNATFMGSNNPVFIPGSYNGYGYSSLLPVQAPQFYTNFTSTTIPALTSTVIQNLSTGGLYAFNATINPTGGFGAIGNGAALISLGENVNQDLVGGVVAQTANNLFALSTSQEFVGFGQVVVANPTGSQFPFEFSVTKLA